MRRISLIAAMLAPAMLLAACDNGTVDDGDIEDQAREEAPDETGVAVDGIASEQVEGIDDPVPVLQALGTTNRDLGPNLGACTFAHGGETLFLAGSERSANARGVGAIQVTGVDRRLAGAEMGGYDYVKAGPTMTDGEYTVTVERAEGSGQSADGGTRWAAELVVRKDMANEVRYAPGTWTCDA